MTLLSVRSRCRSSLLSLFQEKAAELLRAYRSSEFANSAILSFPELCTLSADVCADESALCMALLQLQRDKQVTVSLHEGEKVKEPASLWREFVL